MKNCNALILLIAGSSKRFGGKIKKQFIKIDDKPIFIHTLLNMLKFRFNNIVLVCAKDEIENVRKYIEKEELITKTNKKNMHYVEGGNERVYSVYNAINYLHSNNIKTDYVFIHDGVRPIVSKKEIESLYNYVLKNDAAILASKVVDTIKKADKNNNILDTIDRTSLYRAATPQAFNFNKYLAAINKYIKAKNQRLVTDDAEIYSKYSGKVGIVECSSNNIKITKKEDLFILKKLKKL